MGMGRLAGGAVLLLFMGCASSGAVSPLQGKVEVFGVEFGSRRDITRLDGVPGVEEPCLKGYERSFDPLAVTIGYGFDRKIRKIVTRNPGTRIFGVAPGMSAVEGGETLRRSGLREDGPFKFSGAGASVTLLVDRAGRIFGVALETEK